MTMLWDPPPGIQASGSRSAARHRASIAERCSAARVRCAAANCAAPLPPVRRPAHPLIATGGSAGNQTLSSFFVLPRRKPRW